jgi:serine/threonine protein kinase
MNDDPLIGQQLSNVLIKRVLGRGGMAQVYYGLDVKLQRPVAIKVIDARYRGKPSYAQRFVKEARAVARWRHENIVQIYYANDQDGLYYYVMEYIDGQDLSTYLSTYTTRGDLLPAEEILRIGRAVASALDYAHSQGVIHRDVKPSNVLLSNDGRVILSDFGLSLDMQAGSSGEILGTPHYVSPEQARRSTDAVPQSDLYSLGVILYEMLTGVPPFDDISPPSVALQHLTQAPPAPRSINPQLNAETEAVLLKALSKEPHERYQTGAELMNALEEALSKVRPSTERVLPLPPMPAAILAGKTRSVTQKVTLPAKSAPKRRWPFIIMLIVLLLAVFLALGNAFFPGGLAALFAPPLPTASVTPTSSITPALAALFPTQTNTPEPKESPSLTATPTFPPTDTATPTATASETAGPTAAMSVTGPTAISPTPTITLTPDLTELARPTATTTPLYPNYKRMWLYYDQYGFYIYNASDTNRSISQIAFERVNNDGTFANRFDGVNWESLYPILHREHCMRIEVQNSPAYLNPAICRNYYYSTRIVPRDNEWVFWTPKPDSTQFRVLWMGEEVGRCDIGTGFCEVYVP